jgi:hypothetical protein
MGTMAETQVNGKGRDGRFQCGNRFGCCPKGNRPQSLRHVLHSFLEEADMEQEGKARFEVLLERLYTDFVLDGHRESGIYLLSQAIGRPKTQVEQEIIVEPPENPAQLRLRIEARLAELRAGRVVVDAVGVGPPALAGPTIKDPPQEFGKAG